MPQGEHELSARVEGAADIQRRVGGHMAWSREKRGEKKEGGPRWAMPWKTAKPSA